MFFKKANSVLCSFRTITWKVFELYPIIKKNITFAAENFYKAASVWKDFKIATFIRGQ